MESSATAAADAAANLADLPWAEVRRARVTQRTLAGLFPAADQVAPDQVAPDQVAPDQVAPDQVAPDVVVLDPPRSGAGAEVMTAILGSGARVIGYVACDPAALARDVKIAATAGWRLASLDAFDAFPMTHHVECIAGLVPP
jgi:tRNA/tmRNA/rRNA uracil-C5-methylase (TrmA/RlmC/RlmD family)